MNKKMKIWEIPKNQHDLEIKILKESNRENKNSSWAFWATEKAGEGEQSQPQYYLSKSILEHWNDRFEGIIREL